MSSSSNTTDNPPLPASTGADTNAPAASQDVIRAGDIIVVRLSGIPNPDQDGYITQIQVPANGEITVALINHPFQTIGRTTADVAAEITEAYKSGKIYKNPVVTINEAERYVNVDGDVVRPQRVVYTQDLTLTAAISACGGFTEYAKKGAVRILSPGQPTRTVNAVEASKNRAADPVLHAGDHVYVPRSPF